MVMVDNIVLKTLKKLEQKFTTEMILQCFLISLFAMPTDLACLITSGQLFQILAVSILKLFVPDFDLAMYFQIFREDGLNILSDTFWYKLLASILKG